VGQPLDTHKTDFRNVKKSGTKMVTIGKFNVYDFGRLEKPFPNVSESCPIVPKCVRIVPKFVQIVPKRVRIRPKVRSAQRVPISSEPCSRTVFPRRTQDCESDSLSKDTRRAANCSGRNGQGLSAR